MPNEKPNPDDTLSKVLAYVDSPFKLIAILVMGVVAFSGYFLWQNQDLLVGAYRENQKMPSIAEDRIEDAASHLFKHTGAVVVAVFKVNPMFGTRVLHRAYTKEGRDKINDGLDVGLFTSNAANNRDVVALMAGEITCGNYTQAQSEIGLWYIEKGMTFGCRVGVPPDPSRFIGQITVGWAEQPEDMEKIQNLLLIAATMLSRSKQ